MKRLTKIVLIFLFSYSISFGQLKARKKIMYLPDFKTGKKVTILFKSDTFTIITSTEYLLNYYHKTKDTLGWFRADKELFLKSYSFSIDTLNFFKIASEESIEHILIYRASELIKIGKCQIINLVTNKKERKYTFYKYEDFDISGKIFYIEHQKLFKTIEEIY